MKGVAAYRRPPGGPRFVYFAQDVETGWIKIGGSRNPLLRVKTMTREGRHVRCRLLVSMEIGVWIGSEGDAHRAFSKWRLPLKSGEREWYHNTVAIKCYLHRVHRYQLTESLGWLAAARKTSADHEWHLRAREREAMREAA